MTSRYRAVRFAVIFVAMGLAPLVTPPGWSAEKNDAPASTGQVAQVLDTRVTIDVKMNYLLFLPEGYSPQGDAWPLILFLHGGGESGDDLELVKKHGPPKIVETKKDFPFVVVSPQSARGGWEPHALIALLDDVLASHNVDPDRVYLTGLSMGGSGTWQLAAEYPERFAAIVPICGRGRPDDAARLRPLPIWVFHGAQDTTVSLRYSQRMVDAVRKVGGDVKLTIYPDAGHDSWTQTYDNPEVYRWLLEHRRPQGAFSGTWGGRGGRGGTLECVTWKLGGERWMARFSGFCNREFLFDVEMTGRQKGDDVQFDGVADLGEPNGGIYQWTGRIRGDVFTGEYSSSKSKAGEFRMQQSGPPPAEETAAGS